MASNATVASHEKERVSESRRDMRGKWIFALNVGYYLLPFLFAGFIYAIETFGVAWFEQMTAFLNSWNPVTAKFNGTDLATVVMFRLCLIALLYGLVRLFVALAIPPERTAQQNLDMVLAIVPIGVIGFIIGRHHFLGIAYGIVEWYFLLFSLIICALMDFFGARLAQKIIAAYRRRVDVV